MIALDLFDLRRVIVREEPEVAVKFGLLRRHRAAAERPVWLGRGQHRELDALNQFVQLPHTLFAGRMVSHQRCSFNAKLVKNRITAV